MVIVYIPITQIYIIICPTEICAIQKILRKMRVNNKNTNQ